jgi:hypothetical protein
MDAAGLVGVLAVTFALWYAHMRLWPWKACPGCKGSGRRRAPMSKAWRDCPTCGGKGRRQRLPA